MNIHLDATKNIVKFDGWGMSLAWMARQLTMTCSDDIKREFMDLTFGDDGLKLNVLRYLIGGGDNPEHKHLHDRAAMDGFQSANGTYDWEADPQQKWMLFEAIKRNANILRAFSISPPYWMTISKCSAGNTDGSDNLPKDKYNQFANYLANVLLHFKNKYNITFE